MSVTILEGSLCAICAVAANLCLSQLWLQLLHGLLPGGKQPHLSELPYFWRHADRG